MWVLTPAVSNVNKFDGQLPSGALSIVQVLLRILCLHAVDTAKTESRLSSHIAGRLHMDSSNPLTTPVAI